MNPRAGLVTLIVLGLGVVAAHNAPAVPDSRLAPPTGQFGLPFAGPPGVNSWLLGQLYGSTTGAYRRRSSDYRAGQGIHFGMDFSAPCGTPVRAIGDGVVAEVDGPHGSPPHNLVLNHAGNLSSLYGHLLRRSSLRVGQRVKRGEVIAVSGDSQFTCISAPHLHLEIRDSGHQRFLNPVRYLDADWDSLTLAGSFGRGYQRDLSNPRRWQSLSDQPQARRGGAPLNNFALPWPPAPNDRRLSYPPRVRVIAPAPTGSPSDDLEAGVTKIGVARRLTGGGCCVSPFWSADSTRVLFIDRPTKDAAGIYGVNALNPTGSRLTGTVAQFSASQRFAVLPGETSIVERLRDGKRVTLPTKAGNLYFSDSETKLAWSVSGPSRRYDTQPTQIYVSSLNSASSLSVSKPKLLATLYGASIAGWIGEAELLVTGKSSPSGRDRSLRAINVTTGAGRVFSTALSQRGVSLSPGSRWVAYYVAFDSVTRNGLFVLDTKTGSQRRLDAFGSYRWRDANNLLLIPLEVNATTHRLLSWDAKDGQKRELVRLNAKVTGDDWQVSPNGSRVVYLNAKDRNLYALELPK